MCFHRPMLPAVCPLAMLWAMLWAMLLAVLLTACGQKGPLSLPEAAPVTAERPLPETAAERSNPARVSDDGPTAQYPTVQYPTAE